MGYKVEVATYIYRYKTSQTHFIGQIYTKVCANLTNRQIIQLLQWHWTLASLGKPKYQHKFLASSGKMVFLIAGKSRNWKKQRDKKSHGSNSNGRGKEKQLP